MDGTSPGSMFIDFGPTSPGWGVPNVAAGCVNIPASFTFVAGGTALAQPVPIASLSDVDIDRIARRVVEMLRAGKEIP